MNRELMAAAMKQRSKAFSQWAYVLLPVLLAANTAWATRTITTVSLNGGAVWTFATDGSLISAGDPVSVGAGDSISVTMTVVTSGSSSANDWESSSWQIATASGTWICADSANFTNSGTHTTTFSIIAPATTGSYHSYFRAHDGDTCGGSSISKPVQLVNSVTVEPQEPNPPLDEACGLDIVLVLDVSGSIGSNITQVKDAANAFVNAFLPGTPTLIGLVKFNETATVLEDLTSDTAALSADIAGLASGGWTNWQAAIMAARGLLEGGSDRDDSVHPDMIVVVTDGDPTASTAGSSTSTQPNVHLAPAVIQADLAKTSSTSMPIRMVAVGVGAATQSRLVAISGSNVSPPNPLDATVDVVLDNFGGLADALNDLALTMCGGTITVHKIIDLDGNAATTGDQSNGSGWTFTTNVDPPDTSSPPSGMTDAGGYINFAIDLGANGTGVVDILETLQSAFTFMSASCKIGATPVGTPGTNSVDNISIGAADIVTCTFYNRPKFGACCNTNIAGSNCTDNLTQSQCSGAGFVWTPNVLCSAVSCCSSNELCADSDPCTTDTCVSGTGCVHSSMVCNDNNPCTSDACVGGNCVYTPVTCPDNGNPCSDLACDPSGPNGNCNLTVPVNNGSACDDGLYCTISEVCSNGSCGGGAPRDCSDSVACTNDSCDEANDVCVHNAVNAKCNDGLYCNGSETCHETLGCQAGTPPCSPDGVACTVDGCDEATDTCTHIPNAAACSDGLYCNGNESCDELLGCQAGTSPCPADSVTCTVDGCDEATDTCTHVPNDAACNDSFYCNGVETCDALLGCQAGTSPCPADSVDCTIDGCDESTDTCTHLPNHKACNDYLYCNGVETCDALLGCQAGTSPCPADSVACTVDGCDEATDTCTHVPNDGACSDGLFCNGVETCDALLGCQAGTSPCSPDSVACTEDGCDEAADACTHVPVDSLCSDGLYCNGTETCDPVNGCQPGTSPCPPDSVACTVDGCDEGTDSCTHVPDNGACDDGLYCNGDETCDPLLGCQSGTSPCPPDSVACTIDTCDESSDTCLHTPDDAACQNGSFCDGVEVCNPTTGCEDSDDPCLPPTYCDEPFDRCVKCLTDAHCNDGLYCNGEETCNTVTGSCVPGTPPCSDDGVACTTTVCVEPTDTCLHVDNCTDDGLYCNGTESCDLGSGQCVHSGSPCPMGTKCDEPNDRCVQCLSDAQCDDGLYCNGLETCNLTTGTCQSGTAPCSPDTVDCTIDGCDEATDTCTHTPDDSVCNDGLYCNGVETCDAIQGCQAGTPPCSPDSVSCTIDGCDEATDTCTHAPDDAACNDGLYCNGVETCDAIQGCLAGTTPCPPDNVSCTNDGCDEATDACTHVPKNSLCSDGLYCNGDETCHPTQGCVPGTPPCTPDSVSCTVDGCDEATDTCTHVPDNAACNDGLFCNGVETCDPLLGCQAGTSPCPADAISCTIDGCDEATDMCTHVPNDAACNDGFFCNGVETCDPNQGCLRGTSPCPADSVACTIDACDEATDSCTHAPDDAACNDGQFCNGVETCDSLQGCLAGPNPCPPDAVACTVDGCNEATDMCTHTPNNAACNDGLFCNGVETCDAVQGCLAGSSPCPPDSVACTVDGCDEATDMCTHVPNNATCNDGQFCNGVETCDAVQGCLAGSSPCPADAVACTTDGCNEATDTCTHVPNNAACNDGFFCNGTETCDPVLGCQAGASPCAPDNVACTVDGCDESSDTCTHVPVNSLCNDELFCTGVETCDPILGCLLGTGVDCSALNDACNIGVCNESLTTCVRQPTNEGDSCSSDGLFCNGAELCQNGNCVSSGSPCPPGLFCIEPTDSCASCLNSGMCDDDDECTDDSCQGGSCVHVENGLCGPGGDLGACCFHHTGICVNNIRRMNCTDPAEFYEGIGCDEVICERFIPTVSEWGLVIMALLLATGAKLCCRRGGIQTA